jgi:beta-lactamase class A
MIGQSDNNAAELLYDNLDTDFLNQVFSDVGLDFPPNKADVSFMTVKDYSYFFRLLYNSTYLIRPYSEEALKYLAESDFPQGIESGVPADTAVANKFGERTVYGDSSNTTIVDRELHDCGIIYYPEHPYLLCVMTRGKDFDQLTSVIDQIAKMSWSMAENLYSN